MEEEVDLAELDEFFMACYIDDPDVTFSDEAECGPSCDAPHGVNEPHEMEVDDN